MLLFFLQYFAVSTSVNSLIPSPKEEPGNEANLWLTLSDLHLL